MVVVVDLVVAQGGHGARVWGLHYMVGACARGVDFVDERVGGGDVAEDAFCHGGAACLVSMDSVGWTVTAVVRHWCWGRTDVAEADEEDVDGAVVGSHCVAGV